MLCIWDEHYFGFALLDQPSIIVYAVDLLWDNGSLPVVFLSLCQLPTQKTHFSSVYLDENFGQINVQHWCWTQIMFQYQVIFEFSPNQYTGAHCQMYII